MARASRRGVIGRSLGRLAGSSRSDRRVKEKYQMRSSTWREQAGMREQIGAEDPSKGGRDAPNRLGWHQGRRRPSGERRRRVALQKWLNCRPIRATAPCARRSLVVGAPPATATGHGPPRLCLRPPQRPQPDQVVDHADDGSSAARDAGRSGPRAQRPIPSPCGALSARSCSASGRQRRRRRAAAFGGWWPSPSSASVSQAARSSGVRHLPRNRSASPPGTVRSYRATGPRAASASRPTPSRRLIPRCRSAPGCG